MMKKLLGLALLIISFSSFVNAQQSADVTLTLNEQFFDALLDAVFTNLQTPSFPLAVVEDAEKPATGIAENALVADANRFEFRNAMFEIDRNVSENAICDESIRLMREIDGVKTSVRFRDGKIFVPIAFNGSYNPPLIGCIDFQGWADSTIALEFDQNSQTLIGRATVSNVRLSGTGGIGSSLIARLVQSSIDSKINPINILQMDKVSFVVPVQNAGALKMKATKIRHEIVNGAMNIHLTYQFSKG
jgi:hypothetical protein